MPNWIRTVGKTAIPFAVIPFLTAYAQQMLSWAVLALAGAVVFAVVVVVVTLVVFVSIAMAREKQRKALISLIKAVKH